MHRSRIKTPGLVAGSLLLAIAAVAAACGAAPGSSPVPATPHPSGQPSAGPPEAPAETPSDGSIDLDTADGHDVSVVVVDKGRVLAGAGSGRAGDGMSVRWGRVQVENLDEDSLRVTWVGLPVDAEIRLEVAARGDGYVLAFEQPAPPAYSDAVGFDRVLVLDFGSPVKAGDVQATFSTAALTLRTSIRRGAILLRG